jgi:hypothetical protein
MWQNRLHARLIIGLTAGSVLALFALMLAGCPNAAGDCHNTLSCQPPSCAEAGDVEGCIPDDEEDGGSDAQAD